MPFTPGEIALPNACTAQPQTQQQLVTGVADPFALQYLPLRRGGATRSRLSTVDFDIPDEPPGIIAKDIRFQDLSFALPDGEIPAMVGNVDGGGPLLSIHPIRSVEWWHVTIWAQELIRDSLVNPEPFSQEQVRGSQQVSMLKARIAWTEHPSIERSIVVDIGTGLDIFVGPTPQIISIDIMVPDPGSAPPLRPGAFTTSALPPPSTDPPRFRFDSYVVASAWCVYGSVGRPEGRFTQSVALLTDPVLPDQGFVDVPIPDNGRRVQVFSSLNVPGAPRPPGPQFGFESPAPISFGSGIPVIPTSLGSFPFIDTIGGGLQTLIVDVPQTAKFLRLSRGAEDNVQTAVFEGQQ